MKKRVLITGLTGLVGSGLMSYLKNDESYEVVSLCRFDSDIDYIQDYCIIEYGDILDPSTIERIMEKYQFDMLVHVASKSLLVCFAELAKKYNIPEVIMVSSTYACSIKYPNNKQLLIENETDKILSSYSCSYAFLRPTAIFGSRPNGVLDGNISTFSKWVKKMRFFPLFNRGKATVRPIWGKDVGYALYLMMNNISLINEKRLICAGDKKRTFKELIVLLGTLNNKKIRFIYLPAWFGYFIIHALYYITFKNVDVREKINRLLEDKCFETSNELLELGYTPHTFFESYTIYDVSK